MSNTEYLRLLDTAAVAATDESARYLPEIKAACGRVARLVDHALEQGALPLVLGGDHSVAMGTLGGLAKTRAPRDVNPVDWVAERAWLLLRLGEADAARMLVAGVDTDKFTPKMTQVAVQSALANADPSGLCPLQDGIRDVERGIFPLVDAM